MSKTFPWDGPYEIHPGVTLDELLQELGISQAELARRSGRPTKTINGIIKGSISITPETAIQFERVLGAPAGFWNSLESNYQEAIARRKERERLQSALEWMRQFPVLAMVKRGWIEKKKDSVEQLQTLLGFLGAASPESWDNHWRGKTVWFRGADGANYGNPAIAAWLRKGFLEAREIECQPFSEASFRSTLDQARTLTLNASPSSLGELQRRCAECGVALVLVQELPGCRVSGAARWINATRGLVQLSLRYRSNDQLWFSFFHEAAHILQGQKKSIFLDQLARKPGTLENQVEEKANRFAADHLVPRGELVRFIQSGEMSKAAVKSFAARIGIHPGIVVGRLQHEGFIRFSWMNDLKVRYQ